jgi:hypothetical protein
MPHFLHRAQPLWYGNLTGNVPRCPNQENAGEKLDKKQKARAH